MLRNRQGSAGLLPPRKVHEEPAGVTRAFAYSKFASQYNNLGGRWGVFLLECDPKGRVRE